MVRNRTKKHANAAREFGACGFTVIATDFWALCFGPKNHPPATISHPLPSDAFRQAPPVLRGQLRRPLRGAPVLLRRAAAGGAAWSRMRGADGPSARSVVVELPRRLLGR